MIRTNAYRTLSEWRWWLPPAALSLILIILLVDPFIGDWDALEYTVSALQGHPSSMALGRGLFIFYNHALYVIAHGTFGLSPQRAYLLFKYVVVAQGPLAVIACWVLTRDLSGSRGAAMLAALLVTFSPNFVIYSGQVMTDVPALLLVTVALTVHLRGLQQQRVWLLIIGAALLGAGVNLRETVGFYLPWLLFAPFVCGWRANRRALLLVALSFLLFTIFAGSGFLYWFLFDPSYRAAWHGWRESMRAESELHPVSIRMLWPWAVFFLATSPLVALTLPLGAINEWRRHRLSPVLLLAANGLLANVLLLLNYSTAIGWRYFLTGLPTLVPLTSSYLLHALTKRLGSPRRAFIVAAAGIGLLGLAVGAALWPVRSNNLRVRAASKDYEKQLKLLPKDAVMISGAQSVAVKYWRGVGLGDWDVVGPGAGWPGAQLPLVVESYLKQGHRVFLDADPRWWPPCGWRVQEIEQLTRLELRFHFRRVSGAIYEIRPVEDDSASDQPHLETLLSANRLEDVKKCFNPE